MDDLFEKIKVKSLKYKTSELPDKAINEFVLPALTAGIQNQGLNNYVPKDNATILKNVISISANGANTGATFYQNKEFTVLQDAYAIEWKYTNNSLTDNHYLFLVNTISKTIFGHYEWTNKAGWERIKTKKIQLPTKNKKIDFQFMEDFIAEIETQRIKKLDAYLEASGLKDYNLTEEEEQVLADFENGKVAWGEFRLGDLFDIKNTLSFNKDKLTTGETYDYVTRTSQNQGIFQSTGFINQSNINPKGIWSLGLLQMDFFYRKKPWYAGQFVRKIIPRFQIKEKIIPFFTVILNGQKEKFLSVLVRNIDKVFLDTKVQLPTKNKKIDFQFMQILISAIQKQVIKDVVLYLDKKMENN